MPTHAYEKEPPLARRLDELPPRAEEVTGDELLDRFLAYVAEQGPHALSGAGGGAPRARRREERDPRAPPPARASRWSPRSSTSSPSPRASGRIYTAPDQGAGQREVLRPLPRLRPRARGDDDRRRQPSTRTPSIICCTAEILANKALREGRRRRRRLRGHGRVPLLRRQGARRRLADPAPHAAARDLPPHVRHAGRHRRSSRRRSRR